MTGRRTHEQLLPLRLLRRLLNERGVEWACVDTRNGEEQDNLTEWNVPNAGWVTAWEFGGHLSYTWHMGEKPTPQQAIAATLGSCNCSNNCTNGERTETCHIDLVGYNQREDRFQCRSCDWYMWFKRGTWPQFNYCPNCGRRCVG